jgi:hypothetical protein
VSVLRRQLVRDFVALLAVRIKAEHAALIATAMLRDLGMDDCPVCIAARHREAWEQ